MGTKEGRLKTSIYLPGDLAEQVHVHRISISRVAQVALRNAVQAATIEEDVLADLRVVAERLAARSIPPSTSAATVASRAS